MATIKVKAVEQRTRMKYWSNKYMRKWICHARTRSRIMDTQHLNVILKLRWYIESTAPTKKYKCVVNEVCVCSGVCSGVCVRVCARVYVRVCVCVYLGICKCMRVCMWVLMYYHRLDVYWSLCNRVYVCICHQNEKIERKMKMNPKRKKRQLSL